MPLASPAVRSRDQAGRQGTERVEDLLRDRFLEVALARLDRDAVRRKGDLQSILGKVLSGEARILGVRRCSQGPPLPDVTLVVIVNADQGLFSADFRASERLAQTIAGRGAGRVAARRSAGADRVSRPPAAEEPAGLRATRASPPQLSQSERKPSGRRSHASLSCARMRRRRRLGVPERGSRHRGGLARSAVRLFGPVAA
jgi:primosomal protein N' (replication factor Y)